MTEAEWLRSADGRRLATYLLGQGACPPEIMERLVRVEGGQARTDLWRVLDSATVRHMVGNPWRVVEWCKGWRTPDVLALVEALLAGDQEACLPLADALMEAGCTDEDAIRHLLGWRRCYTCLGRGLLPLSWTEPEPGETQWNCWYCDTRGWVKEQSQSHGVDCWVVRLLNRV